MMVKRSSFSSSAAGQGIRSKSPALRPAPPLGTVLLRRMGYSTRSEEYTRSRYLATLPQRNPRVTGCEGSPCILTARPELAPSVSTVIRTPQASGQSCGHAAYTCFFIASLPCSDYKSFLSRLTEVKVQGSSWTTTTVGPRLQAVRHAHRLVILGCVPYLG